MPDHPCECCDDSCLCFPGYGNSIVTLESGRTYIEDVKVGDLAKVVLDDGSFGYSEVWTLAHHNPATESNFNQIETDNRRLNISPRHFLVVNRNNERLDVMAKDVKVGDELIVYDEMLYKDAPGSEEVVDIEVIEGKGVFAPFTKQGRLIVNGVLVSCYAEVNPSLAHTALAPLRAMYDVTPTAAMDTVMTRNANGVPHVFNTTLNVVKSLVTE
ncbi:hypothetical protein SNE40_008232 [Patella caerulea]|uniref:Hint domain-containing protein n=1 Tax=Patella caerulea TaxID=87958 RepID=A0AAN8QA60_PATCE